MFKLKIYYIRYLLVIALLAISFFAGKNLVPEDSQQQQLNDLAYQQRNSALGVYRVDSDDGPFTLEKSLLVSKQQCGRLFMTLKRLPQADGSSIIGGPDVGLKVSAYNNLFEKQDLKTLVLKSDQFSRSSEIDFCANADYQNIQIEPSETEQEFSYQVSDVNFYPLAISSTSFSGIKESIIGNTDFSSTVYDTGTDLEKAVTAIKFTKQNQMIGQMFTSDSNMISSVEMKLGFEGTGGIGNYCATIREVSSEDGKNVLSANIASFYFDVESANREYKISSGVYRIPLPAKLEKGKTYFVGIQNNEVKANFLNHLKIYGTASATTQASAVNNGNFQNQALSLYLKVYGAKYENQGGEKILTSAKILDDGDGSGTYIYKQRGDFSDFLDIDQLKTPAGKPGNVLYDSVQKGVSGIDSDSDSFIYKIYTVYPISRMSISAKQPGGDFTNSVLSYSLDNTNWQVVKSDWDKDESLKKEAKNSFNISFTSNGQQNYVYIKVTYDPDDSTGKSIHLFGLINLKVAAELKIEK